MRVKKVLLKIFIDIVLAGCFLIVFALFHHVISKELKSDGLVVDTSTNAFTCNCNTDKYTCDINSTDTLYSSENIFISLETHDENISGKKVRYHVADIYVKDIKSIETVFANDKYGRGYTESILDMDKRTNAILAINGDFYGLTSSGVVIRNGVVYRTEKPRSEVGVLFSNGELKVYSANSFNADDVIKNGAYQAWTFGPSLLSSDGKALTEFPTSVVTPKNPRTAIGMVEPGHYIFVNVEGRIKESSGMTMSELSDLFESLGAKVAFNLDGGQSSIMTFNDKHVNNLCEGGRTLSDIIIIKEVNDDK